MTTAAEAYMVLGGASLPTLALPELVIRGHSFQQADGTHWTAVQASDFNLLNKWQHGVDIKAILAQRRDCGFNLLRVWTAYDIPGIGTFLDIDYSRIPAFIDLCRRYGLYVEFCAYTGINDKAHWENLCAAARACQPKPLLELVNELDQNTNEPDPQGRIFVLEDYARPTGLLCSHGSNGSEHLAVRPWWDYEEFHTNDASEWTRKVGHNAMELSDGTVDYEASGVPILSNENTRYTDKCQGHDWAESSIDILAHDAAAGAALLCAGSCYHSQAGKTSDLWADDELLCAQAWAAGARSVDLLFQDGHYRHSAEEIALEEAEGYLRVYRRWYPSDGSYEQVIIRR